MHPDFLQVLLTYAQASEAVSLSRSQIERLVATDQFPQPVRVTPGRVAFVRDEVVAWANARIAERDAGREKAA